MTRTPHAMKALIADVVKRDEDAAVEVINVDGFGVARTVAFGDATTEWLAPLIEGVRDDRIADVWISHGSLHVTFVPDRRADDASSYRLGLVELLVAESDAAEAGEDAYKERREQLEAMKAGELRDEFPQHADLPNKAAIVDAILDEEYE